jgi:hypothetical protein
LTTFSVLAGNVVDTFNLLTEPASVDGNVSDCADVITVERGVDAITTVVVSVQAPSAVHAMLQLEIAICSPFVGFDVSVFDSEAEICKEGEFPSKVPVFVRLTKRFTTSPEPIFAMAPVKPFVMPGTADGASSNFRVPEETDPPEVFDAVAVKLAKTLEETSPAPPATAVAAIVTLSRRVLRFFLANIPEPVFI